MIMYKHCFASLFSSDITQDVQERWFMNHSYWWQDSSNFIKTEKCYILKLWSESSSDENSLAELLPGAMVCLETFRQCLEWLQWNLSQSSVTSKPSHCNFVPVGNRSHQLAGPCGEAPGRPPHEVTFAEAPRPSDTFCGMQQPAKLAQTVSETISVIYSYVLFTRNTAQKILTDL